MDLEALIERPPPGYIVIRRKRDDYEEFEVTPVGFSWGRWVFPGTGMQRKRPCV